MDRVIALEA